MFFLLFATPPPPIITLYHQYRCLYDKKWKLPNENQYLSLLCGQHVFSVKSCFEPILVRTPVDYSGDHTCNKIRG